MSGLACFFFFVVVSFSLYLHLFIYFFFLCITLFLCSGEVLTSRQFAICQPICSYANSNIKIFIERKKKDRQSHLHFLHMEV